MTTSEKHFEIVEYSDKYANEINEMEEKQWGVWEEDILIQDHLKEDAIAFVGLYDNKFAGTVYGKIGGGRNQCHLEVLCIKPEFQKQGLGTLLLERFIKEAKEKYSITKIYAEAVQVNNHCNSQKVLEMHGFRFIKEEQEYWGKLYPDTYCAECNNKPCKCSARLYERKL